MSVLTIVLLVLLVAGFVCTFLQKGPGQVGFNIAVFVILLLSLLGVA